jgi:Branched-chain amino acid transport system / permease component
MSETVGISIGATYVVVFLVSAVLAGIAALLSTMKYAASPDMGLTPVFYAFLVAFTAALGRSPRRVMAVGTLLGVIEGAGAQILSAKWQQVVVFAILLGFLVIRQRCAFQVADRLFVATRRSLSLPGGAGLVVLFRPADAPAFEHEIGRVDRKLELVAIPSAPVHRTVDARAEVEVEERSPIREENRESAAVFADEFQGASGAAVIAAKAEPAVLFVASPPPEFLHFSVAIE